MLKTILKTTVAAAALLIAGTAAHAGSREATSQALIAAVPEIRKLVVTDLAHEAAACSAFYNLGAALGERDWPNMVEQNAAGKRAAEVALQIALAGAEKDVVMAVIKNTLADVGEIVHGDTSRIVIVVNKYGPGCNCSTQPNGAG